MRLRNNKTKRSRKSSKSWAAHSPKRPRQNSLRSQVRSHEFRETRQEHEENVNFSYTGVAGLTAIMASVLPHHEQADRSMSSQARTHLHASPRQKVCKTVKEKALSQKRAQTRENPEKHAKHVQTCKNTRKHTKMRQNAKKRVKTWKKRAKTRQKRPKTRQNAQKCENTHKNAQKHAKTPEKCKKLRFSSVCLGLPRPASACFRPFSACLGLARPTLGRFALDLPRPDCAVLGSIFARFLAFWADSFENQRFELIPPFFSVLS